MSTTPAIEPLTDLQLEAFFKGAEDRFAERNVAPEQAQQLFAQQMDKTAADLGFVTPAEVQQVDELATKIASAMGLKRPTA